MEKFYAETYATHGKTRPAGCWLLAAGCWLLAAGSFKIIHDRIRIPDV
ncbi:hypothetical protein WH736_00660 [Klebsiella michiganensis]|nr:hypothetical protein [Klebsiella michiganensis]